MRRQVLLIPAIVTAGLNIGCFRSNMSLGGGRGTGGSSWTSVGQGGSAIDGAATESACDPLAPKATTLGAIVGVGQDTTGTLYVDSANGIFVSEHGELVRQRVTGSGESGSNDFIFTFESPGSDASSARNLLIDTQGSTASAMALGPAGSKSFLGQSDAGVTSLTLVDSAMVSGMTVVNTPNLIEYIGDVANGEVILATMPVNEESSSIDGGLSIFYGPPSLVAQRTITAFGESLSGNGSVTFLVGNTPFVLAFGMVQGPDAGPFGTFALEGLTPQGGAQIAVTLLRSPTPTSLPSDLSFTCLSYSGSSTSADAASDTQPLPKCGWSTNLNDAGPDGCRASRALVSCNGPSGGCECTSDDATTCPSPATCGLSHGHTTCQDECAAGEYAVACGGVPRPDTAQSNTQPPSACRLALATPGGVAFYCCPCE
jgi:hypothetical protein